MGRADKWRAWLASKDGSDPTERPALAQETFNYSLQNKELGDVHLRIPIEVRELAVECLFDAVNEEVTLASMVLDAIIAAPMDCRRALCENIMVIGGTCELPGFKCRLLAEMRRLAQGERYGRLSTETFKMLEQPAFGNCTGWLGAAIFGELDTIGVRSLSREVYVERGRVPDWTDAPEQKGRC